MEDGAKRLLTIFRAYRPGPGSLDIFPARGVRRGGGVIREKVGGTQGAEKRVRRRISPYSRAKGRNFRGRERSAESSSQGKRVGRSGGRHVARVLVLAATLKTSLVRPRAKGSCRRISSESPRLKVRSLPKALV